MSCVLLVASKQSSFIVLGCPELESFVSNPGGALDKSKNEFMQLLPSLDASVSKMMR